MESSDNDHKLCRLCCKSKANLNKIEDLEQNENYPMKEIFTDTLRLEFDYGDGLPQNICRQCTQTVLQIHETVESYRANDFLLRKQLCPIKEEKVAIESILIEALDYFPDDELITESLEIKEEEPEYLENPDSEPDNEETDDQNEWPPTEETSSNVLEESSRRISQRTKQNNADKNQPTLPQRPRRRRYSENLDRPRMNDFKCYICKSESLGSGYALLTHLHSHKDQLPYKCTICVMDTIIIDTVTTLNIHKRMHENPYKCDYCDRRYTTKRNIALHVQNFHLGENAHCPSTCEICGKVCPSKLSLKTHQRAHTKPISCEKCGKTFSEKSKLKRHFERIHVGTKRYECHICHRTMKTLDAYNFHVENMHSEKLLACSYCPKTYSSKLMLRTHEQKHKRDPNYRVPQSWKEYHTPLDGAEEGLSECKICGVKAKAIVWHMRTAHFPEQYRCDICEAVFKTKESLDGHIMVHTYGKAFQCPICEREFASKRLLQAHMKTKKHRDHPLAKSLDWLAQMKSLKRRNKLALDSSEAELDSC
ncbi:zinc finger protein 878-like [Malaya genurostris]|uniref:zinc finger protein 878-like n=1 Tax=Malaya genurostris TaxID=325434 RepID=UPI0026F39C2C|nr:zinc finger protein 878-like [Malaya genurostris]